jgi:hypothetical protein
MLGAAPDPWEYPMDQVLAVLPKHTDRSMGVGVPGVPGTGSAFLELGRLPSVVT